MSTKDDQTPPPKDGESNTERAPSADPSEASTSSSEAPSDASTVLRGRTRESSGTPPTELSSSSDESVAESEFSGLSGSTGPRTPSRSRSPEIGSNFPRTSEEHDTSQREEGDTVVEDEAFGADESGEEQDDAWARRRDVYHATNADTLPGSPDARADGTDIIDGSEAGDDGAEANVTSIIDGSEAGDEGAEAKVTGIIDESEAEDEKAE